MMNINDMWDDEEDRVSVSQYPYSMIGMKVVKREEGRKHKPFKSGLKINTVKGVVAHPHLHVPAFTFEEDDSYVACYVCFPVENQ